MIFTKYTSDQCLIIGDWGPMGRQSATLPTAQRFPHQRAIFLSLLSIRAQVAWVYVTSRHMSTWRDAWLGNIIFSFFHRSIFQNISHQIPREFEDCTFDKAMLVGQQNMSGFQIGPRENQHVLYGRMCDDLTWKTPSKASGTSTAAEAQGGPYAPMTGTSSARYR